MDREINIKRKNENALSKYMDGKYIEFIEGGHIYSPPLFKLLKEYYTKNQIKTIADFGCGKCEYIINLNASGFACSGFDGTPYTNNSIVKKIDLSSQQSLGK